MRKFGWKWFGTAGHLCVSRFCDFHLTTKVGNYLISTVGGYKSLESDTIGAGDNDFYETMVMEAGRPCKCGCELPDMGSEVEMKTYKTVKEAQEGHIEFCEKYDRISDEDKGS